MSKVRSERIFPRAILLANAACLATCFAHPSQEPPTTDAFPCGIDPDTPPRALPLPGQGGLPFAGHPHHPSGDSAAEESTLQPATMSDPSHATRTAATDRIPVAVTITDSNFFIAVFTLLLSMQFHKVRAKTHVLSVNLTDKEKHFLRQFPGTEVVEATRDNPRGPACRKGEAMVAAAAISPEATHITLLDGDTLATGDITDYLCPEGETLFARWKTPEEDGQIFARRYLPGEPFGTIPAHILKIWQQDVNERETPAIENTVCGGNLTVHRSVLPFIHRWQTQMDGVLPASTQGAHDFASEAYFQVDESVLNSLLAFAHDAPRVLPAKLNIDPRAYVAHLGPNNPKPWVLWRPEKLRYYPQVATFFAWAKQQGYAMPEIPWTFQRRNKLAVIASAHLFGAARSIKGRFKS
jgi:hypothetical protein